MHTALEKRVLGRRGSSFPISERTLPTKTADSWDWECMEGEDLVDRFHSETEPLGQNSLKTVVLGPALHTSRPTVKLPLAQTGKETNENHYWKSLPEDHHLLSTRQRDRCRSTRDRLTQPGWALMQNTIHGGRNLITLLNPVSA